MDSNKKEYESNGYDYQINEYNQITQAKGELRIENGTRNAYAQRIAGGENRHINDDGGHLIGTRFGGSGELDNLVAEDRYINRGSFKSLENDWAKNLEDGNRVKVDIEPVYHGQSERPDIITAKTEIININNEKEIDYFSVTNENLESEEFELPSEADEMMNLWSDRESDNMAKTLTLSNDEFKQPSNDELFASGEEAIDRHMEILRDEMRSDGMEDGPEMENIINSKRDESLSELRSGIYGTDDMLADFPETSEETNAFEESTYENGENKYLDNSFSEAMEYENRIDEYSLDDSQMEINDNSDELNEIPFDEDGFEEGLSDGKDNLELYEDNSFFETSEINDTYFGNGVDTSFTDSMDTSFTDSMDTSFTNSMDTSFTDGLGSSLTDGMDSSLSDSMDFSRGE